MKKLLSFFIVLLIITSCATIQTAKKETEFLEEDINIIAESIENQLPYKSRVLILDFEDIDGVITHFGRYLADKLYIRLSNIQSNIQVIDRRKTDLVLKEQEFQISGYVDKSTAVKISSLTGATHIVNSVVTELANTINIDVKILNVESGTVIGGISHQIIKSREIVSLIRTIIKSEEKKQKELEDERQAILKEIEEEKQKRMVALEEEERQKKAELEKLEQEIREKSIVIAEYDKKKQVLKEKNAYITKIHAEIDRLNRSIEQKLKIGMTFEQVWSVLGIKYPSSRCVIVGKYFLIFEGGALVKVVLIGSRSQSGATIIDSCNSAGSIGVNVSSY